MSSVWVEDAASIVRPPHMWDETHDCVPVALHILGVMDYVDAYCDLDHVRCEETGLIEYTPTEEYERVLADAGWVEYSFDPKIRLADVPVWHDGPALIQSGSSKVHHVTAMKNGKLYDYKQMRRMAWKMWQPGEGALT